MTEFFGCLYYGARHSEEAIALRLADCHLPAHDWGLLTLSWAAPRTAKTGPALAPATNRAAWLGAAFCTFWWD